MMGERGNETFGMDRKSDLRLRPRLPSLRVARVTPFPFFPRMNPPALLSFARDAPLNSMIKAPGGNSGNKPYYTGLVGLVVPRRWPGGPRFNLADST